MSIALNTAGIENPQSVFGGPCDSTQSPFSSGIFRCTGTGACLDLRRNSVCDRRVPCLGDLVLNVLSREAKTVANGNGVRCLFGADPHQEVFATKDRRLRAAGKIDQIAVTRFAEVLVIVWHTQRQLTNETSDRERVHLFGARAIHRASHHRWRGVSLRISRTTVRHTDLLASSQVITLSLLPASNLTWLSPVRYCLFLSKLGNERIACAVLCCNYVEPNAAHALASEGRQVSALHRPAFLPIAGAPAHKAASDSLANSIVLGSP